MGTALQGVCEVSELWDTAKGILATVAPVLGAAIGGPFGGMAARVITKTLLGEESDDPAVAVEAIRNATPDQLLALKKADHEFQARMKELDIRLEEISASDRDSARRRQIETKDRMPAAIALAALAGFFGILLAMVFVDIPPSAAQPLAVMLGALGGLVTSIGNYYFGSSAGSAKKNDIIAGVMRK